MELASRKREDKIRHGKQGRRDDALDGGVEKACDELVCTKSEVPEHSEHQREAKECGGDVSAQDGDDAIRADLRPESVEQNDKDEAGDDKTKSAHEWCNSALVTGPCQDDRNA